MQQVAIVHQSNANQYNLDKIQCALCKGYSTNQMNVPHTNRDFEEEIVASFPEDTIYEEEEVEDLDTIGEGMLVMLEGIRQYMLT